MNRNKLLTVGLVVASCVFAASLVEIGARLAFHAPFQLVNFNDGFFSSPHRHLRWEYDAELGWRPPANATLHVPEWKESIRTFENGVRSNGVARLPITQRPLTLAVGDSFTFGDEVGDAETWPAYLERDSGAPVINAGGPGYGMDQIYLRLAQLLPVYRPDRVVFAIIAGDLLRMQYSRFGGGDKPYFLLEDGELRVHREQMAPPLWRETAPTPFGILGYSLTASRFMKKFANYFVANEYFQQPVDAAARQPAPIPLGCKIGQALAALTATEKVEAYFVMIGELGDERGKAAFAALKKCLPASLTVVDTAQQMTNAGMTAADAPSMYQWHHFNAKTNARIAQIIGAEIGGHGPITNARRETRDAKKGAW